MVFVCAMDRFIPRAQTKAERQRIFIFMVLAV
jgi:hypothetical protein